MKTVNSSVFSLTRTTIHFSNDARDRVSNVVFNSANVRRIIFLRIPNHANWTSDMVIMQDLIDECRRTRYLRPSKIEFVIAEITY